MTITPVNDNSPVITSNGGGDTADINVAENVLFITTVSASDLDLPAQTLVYSVGGGADGVLFDIDSVTGELNFVSLHDREMHEDSDMNGVYEVLVVVSDGLLSDSQLIRVSLTDTDEFDVTDPVDTDASLNLVDENSAPGTSVGLIVYAVDNDATNSLVTYSLTDDAGGRFAIDSITGAVTTAVALDHEASALHQITVRATSADGSTSEADFVISVADINERPEAFADEYSTSYIDSLLITSPSIISNDFDPDGDGLQVILLAGPTSGTLILNTDGSMTYTPVSGYIGDVSIRYAVSDGQLQSDAATITIHVVVPDNVPPPIDSDRGGSSSGENSGGDGSTSISGPSENATENGSTGQPGVTTVYGFAQSTNLSLLSRSTQLSNGSSGSSKAEYSSGLTEAVNLLAGEGDQFLQSAGPHTLYVQELPSLQLNQHTMKLQLQELAKIQLVFAELHSAVEVELSQDYFAHLDPMVTTAVGTGVVIWLIHVGQVVAALLSTASSWVQLDPLTVLQQSAATLDVADNSEEKLFDARHEGKSGS
ncbi:MAG: cadherin domain-containing protein [Pirellulaceae bacterium]